MTVVTKTEREEYTVTVNAPTEFLTSATTVYPVTVDPTFRIDETELITTPDGDYTANAIEDLCIYTSSPSPTSGYLSNVGNYYYDSEGETVYTSRMLYKINSDFEDLMNLSYYISNPQFFHARLYVKGFAVEDEVTLVASPFTADWSSGVSQCVDEETYYSHSSSGQSTTVVTNTLAQSIGIDITNVLVYYSTHSSTYNNFNMCVSTSDEGNNYDDSCYDRVKIYQTEDSGSDVYISIDYSPLSGSFYINSLESGKFLTGSSVTSVSQTIHSGPTYQGWTFIYQGANKYIIALTANTNRVLSVNDDYCIAIGSKSSTEKLFYTWQVSFYGDTITMYNLGSGEYLVPSDTNIIGTSMDDVYGHWRICKTDDYVPLTSFSVGDIVANFGDENITPTIAGKAPSNATWASVSDFNFISSNSSIVSVSNNRTINIGGISTIDIIAVHIPTGLTYTFKTEIVPMLIYRTRNREQLGFANPSNENDITPIIAEDLLYANENDMVVCGNNKGISLTDLYNNIIDKIPLSLSERMTKINAYCLEKIDNTALRNVFTSMMNHFISGTGTDYSNISLTNAIVSHNNTTEYTQGVIEILKSYLSNNSGNISGLYYDENLWIQPTIRENHPMVNAMSSNDLYEPSYGATCGEAGLILCVDSLYGNKFEIESYEKNGSNYSGVLKFTFYDHFGLDTPDLSTGKFLGLKAGQIDAFRQWFILQHWDSLGYATQPKPFVTIIEFTVPFSGSIS